jgi:hypothetical protein
MPDRRLDRPMWFVLVVRQIADEAAAICDVVRILQNILKISLTRNRNILFIAFFVSAFVMKNSKIINNSFILLN